MPTVTVEFNDQEQHAILQMLDGALKQQGMAVLDTVLHFRSKFHIAQQALLAPAPAAPLAPPPPAMPKSIVPRPRRRKPGPKPGTRRKIDRPGVPALAEAKADA